MARLPNPKKLTPDELVERWTKWLKVTEKASFHLYRSRYTWENIARLFKANEPLQTDGGHIFEWMHHNFWNEHAMAIRKEMEHGSGYLTLMNFLDELERFSEIMLTRKRWKTLYSQAIFHEYGIPDEDFDGLPGAMCRMPKQSPDTDCISSNSIHRARINLKNVNKKVVDFAHAFVAHRTNVEKHDVSLGHLQGGEPHFRHVCSVLPAHHEQDMDGTLPNSTIRLVQLLYVSVVDEGVQVVRAASRTRRFLGTAR